MAMTPLEIGKLETLLFMKYNLSPRQQMVAIKAYSGMKNPEIAEEIHVCIETVKYHLGYVFKKCKVKNRKDLIALIDKIGQKKC